jgi:hypothetical protein
MGAERVAMAMMSPARAKRSEVMFGVFGVGCSVVGAMKCSSSHGRDKYDSIEAGMFNGFSKKIQKQESACAPPGATPFWSRSPMNRSRLYPEHFALKLSL